VDATKAFWGGVSNFGYTKIVGGLEPFSAALEAATAGWHHSRKTSWFRVTPESDPPADWKDIVRANWINGRPTADQKAAVKALINVGLSADTASSVAEAGHVNEDILKTAATAIGNGTTPPPEGANIILRLNTSIDAAMDGAFEEADQQYRNMARLLSGVFAIGLAVFAGSLVAPEGVTYWSFYSPDLWKAFLVGFVAVPLAPVAKDLTSSLQAAATAMKSTKS
jgi:hypothetical protein